MSQEDEYAAMRERYLGLVATISTTEADRKKAGMDFDRFCGSPKVMCVAVDSVSFAFTTSRLVMTGHLGPLGLEPIATHINLLSKAIKCVCVKGSGRVHPHVFSGGDPCFGDDNRALLTMLFGKRRAAELGLFMIRFFEQYGDNSWCASPADWEKLTGEEVARWIAER
jgi:hypothetical protein